MTLPTPKAYSICRQRRLNPVPIPDDILAEAEAHLDRYIVNLVPKHAQDKVRIGYFVKGMAITLFEQRPYWKDKSIWTKSDITRVRYKKANSIWTLYFKDRNEKWRIYDPLPPTPDFGQILREIQADPTGIFWG